ncbi:MAG: Dam family site-specific DNA-(adenine-N6)-methyltransferase [Sphingomonadaceae bacterium]|jgi:DNA adenine methylase|nr:Dam family site-specific DNA-(adenine-N6)-methyltransferase [Sphingomonadaceae bacterium]
MRTKVPPLKTQGIKTKLVPFIRAAINWSEEMRWVEPFVGSGVVAFNIQPKRALLCDSNPHLIDFYRGIKEGLLSPQTVRDFLEHEGECLKQNGEDYYYEVRERFNAKPNPFDFLFLNRSCFNGMIRFNRKGAFNVPFCRKIDRFRPAYVTKIVNQVSWVGTVIDRGEYEFKVQDWRRTLADSRYHDFVYLDPPYVARTTDYHGGWTAEDDEDLVRLLKRRRGGFALSTWLENRYRRNTYVDENFSGYHIETQEHFYHLGATESLRNAITEALVMNEPSPNLATGELEAA